MDTDSTPDVQDLARRLNRLERQNRWFKRSAAAAVGLAVLAFTMGQTRTQSRPAGGSPEVFRTDTVKARSFEVVDEAGSVRAVLTGSNVGAMLEFRGVDGEPCTLLGGSKDGGGLFFGPSNRGDFRAALVVSDDDSTLILTNPSRKNYVQASANDTSPGFWIRDASEEVRAFLGMRKDAPRMILHDANGKPRVVQKVDDKSANVSLLDANGEDRAGIVVAEKRCALLLSDAAATRQAALMVNDKEPTFLMLGPNNHVLFKAP